MKRNQKIKGVHAPAPRPTALAAVILAGVLSLPVFCVLSLIGLLK